MLAHDRRVERRQSLVRVPPRPKAVGEAKEVDFVDGAQRLGDRTLDDLIFQGWNPERALPGALVRRADRLQDIALPRPSPARDDL